MSKRPLDTVADEPDGKMARLDATAVPGVVKKTGVRLPVILYKEGDTLNQLVEYVEPSEDGSIQNVEIRIPGHLVSSVNRKVRSRQLWGSDVYTSDSDLVAVLMHCGYIHHTIQHPLRDVAEVRAVVKPMPSQSKYISVPRNSIRSRSWNSRIEGCSYCVEKAWVVTRSGNSYDLSPLSAGNSYAVVPTFTPSRHERMVTRSSVGPASKQRQSQEITVVFSMSNDPWIKYSLQAVCDQGLKPHDRTSAKLRSHVLLMETYSERFELSKKDERKNGEELYSLAKCLKIQSCKEIRALGVPLPSTEKSVIHDGLLWEELQWGTHAVVVRGTAYPIVKVQFMERDGA